MSFSKPSGLIDSADVPIDSVQFLGEKVQFTIVKKCPDVPSSNFCF